MLKYERGEKKKEHVPSSEGRKEQRAQTVRDDCEENVREWLAVVCEESLGWEKA